MSGEVYYMNESTRCIILIGRCIKVVRPRPKYFFDSIRETVSIQKLPFDVPVFIGLRCFVLEIRSRHISAVGMCNLNFPTRTVISEFIVFRRLNSKKVRQGLLLQFSP